jgi:hypothetical protein
MKNKVILKNTPFGFRSTAELFNKMVTPKFVKLKETKAIDDYYDFILTAGVVRDWLRNEFSIEKADAGKCLIKTKCTAYSIPYITTASISI